MDSINQTNLNERDFSYNRISLNKSQKFQDSIIMRLMMWNKFLSDVVNNPQMIEKEICHHLGLKVGTINSIQRHYKLQSSFYFKKKILIKRKILLKLMKLWSQRKQIWIKKVVEETMILMKPLTKQSSLWKSKNKSFYSLTNVVNWNGRQESIETNTK